MISFNSLRKPLQSHPSRRQISKSILMSARSLSFICSRARRFIVRRSFSVAHGLICQSFIAYAPEMCFKHGLVPCAHYYLKKLSCLFDCCSVPAGNPCPYEYLFFHHGNTGLFLNKCVFLDSFRTKKVQKRDKKGINTQ